MRVVIPTSRDPMDFQDVAVFGGDNVLLDWVAAASYYFRLNCMVINFKLSSHDHDLLLFIRFDSFGNVSKNTKYHLQKNKNHISV